MIPNDTVTPNSLPQPQIINNGTSHVTPNFDLDTFLIDALKSQKDRSFVLRIDNEILSLLKDKHVLQKEFPPMNAYQRMIVHKIAHHYQLSHYFVSDRNAVIVFKNENSGIPVSRLRDLIEEPEEQKMTVKLLAKPKVENVEKSGNGGSNESAVEKKGSEGNKFKILKKPEIPIVIEKPKETPPIQPPPQNVPKVDEATILEKEKEYELARARIFEGTNFDTEYIPVIEPPPPLNTTNDDEYNDEVILLSPYSDFSSDFNSGWNANHYAYFNMNRMHYNGTYNMFYPTYNQVNQYPRGTNYNFQSYFSQPYPLYPPESSGQFNINLPNYQQDINETGMRSMQINKDKTE